MEKLTDEMKKEIQKMVDEAITTASAFATRKVGDTPTDANQLTPRHYVDRLVASVVSTPCIDVFTSSDTWNRPDGVNEVVVELVGGGGGGGGTGNSGVNRGGGGAGGAF